MTPYKPITSKRERNNDPAWLQIPIWAVAVSLVVSAVWAAQMSATQSLLVHFILLLGAGLPLCLALLTGRTRATWALVIAGVVFAIVIITSIFTVSPGRTITRDLEIISALAVFLAVCLQKTTRLSDAAIGGGMVLAGVTVAAIGGNEYAVQAHLGNFGWRVFSTFFNPGFLSGFLVITIPITLAVLAKVKERALTLGLGFATLLQVVTVVLTGARAGLLALSVALFVFGVLTLSGRALDRKGWARVGIALVVAIGLAGALGRPTSRRVQNTSGEGHSFAFRVYTWRGTEQMALARPLTGFGPGTFEAAYYPYSIAGYTRLAHSNYLQAAAECGIPAAMFLMGGWVLLVSHGALTIMRRKIESSQSAFMAAAVSACAASAVRGIFDSDWWCLPILLGVSAVTGIVVSRLWTGRELTSDKARHSAGWAIGSVTILSLVFVCLLEVEAFYINRAQSCERADDWSGALSAWHSAARTTPWDTSARLRAASLAAIHKGEVIPTDILAEFAQLEKYEPTNPKIPRTLAALYLRAGIMDKGLQQLAKARRRDPKSPTLLLEEARALGLNHQPAEAMRRWQLMITIENSPYDKVKAIPELIEPSYAWAHAALGDEFARLGQPKNARVEWTRAKKILTSFFLSVQQMRPVLEASGLLDADRESNAKALLLKLDKDLLRRP